MRQTSVNLGKIGNFLPPTLWGFPVCAGRLLILTELLYKDLVPPGGLERKDVTPFDKKTYVDPERDSVKKSVKVGENSGPASLLEPPAAASADLGGGLPAIADLRDTSAFANPAASAAQEAQLPPEVQAAIQGLSEAQRQTLLALLMRQKPGRPGP